MADQQPTQSFVAAPSTAPNGETTQQQNKARSTRAERRARNTEKRGAHTQTRNSRVSKSAPRPQQHSNRHTKSNTQLSIDDVINFLYSIRDGDFKTKKTLQERFTFAADEKPVAEKKKKEPSPEKLEKIAKRKEIRAEKRKAKLAARGQQTAESAPVVETAATETTQVVEKGETKTVDVHPDDILQFDDELDYDD